MSYQSDIIEAIKADAALVGYVGTRIFSDFADNKTAVPYIVYSVMSAFGTTQLDGGRDWEFPLLRFSVWARTRANAIEIAARLRHVLEGKNLSGANSVSLSFDNHQSEYDASVNLYGEVMDFRASTKINQPS